MPKGVYVRVKTNHWIGRKHSKETIEKISKARKGISSGSDRYNFKGDKACYIAKHNWIARMLGRPKHCELCGTTEDTMYHWSNKDHKYNRILLDWQRVCVKCHKDYDSKLNKTTNYEI